MRKDLISQDLDLTKVDLSIMKSSGEDILVAMADDEVKAHFMVK